MKVIWLISHYLIKPTLNLFHVYLHLITLYGQQKVVNFLCLEFPGDKKIRNEVLLSKLCIEGFSNTESIISSQTICKYSIVLCFIILKSCTL